MHRERLYMNGGGMRAWANQRYRQTSTTGCANSKITATCSTRDRGAAALSRSSNLDKTVESPLNRSCSAPERRGPDIRQQNGPTSRRLYIHRTCAAIRYVTRQRRRSSVVTQSTRAKMAQLDAWRWRRKMTATHSAQHAFPPK